MQGFRLHNGLIFLENSPEKKFLRTIYLYKNKSNRLI